MAVILLAGTVSNRREGVKPRRIPPTGLGPLYDETSGKDCHSTPNPGGMRTGGIGLATWSERFENGAFDPLTGRCRPVAYRQAGGERRPPTGPLPLDQITAFLGSL